MNLEQANSNQIKQMQETLALYNYQLCLVERENKSIPAYILPPHDEHGQFNERVFVKFSSEKNEFVLDMYHSVVSVEQVEEIQKQLATYKPLAETLNHILNN